MRNCGIKFQGCLVGRCELSYPANKDGYRGARLNKFFFCLKLPLVSLTCQFTSSTMAYQMIYQFAVAILGHQIVPCLNFTIDFCHIMKGAEVFGIFAFWEHFFICPCQPIDSFWYMWMTTYITMLPSCGRFNIFINRQPNYYDTYNIVDSFSMEEICNQHNTIQRII